MTQPERDLDRTWNGMGLRSSFRRTHNPETESLEEQKMAAKMGVWQRISHPKPGT